MNRIIIKKHIAVPASRFSWPGKIRRLALSECTAFFPADVMVREETVHLFFRTEGYRPLKDIRTLASDQCLGILKELLQQLETARDWMWHPDTLVLTPDTVWLRDDGHVRLLCIPDSREVAGWQRMHLFAEGLKGLTDPEGVRLLSRLQSEWLQQPQPAFRITGAIDRMILEQQEYSSYRFIN